MSLIYWEKQDSTDKLCALHCVNSLLQGPYFSEVDLAEIAQEVCYCFYEK
jgi:ataxin-3